MLCCAQAKQQAELEQQLQKSSKEIEELSQKVEERGRALDSLQALLYLLLLEYLIAMGCPIPCVLTADHSFASVASICAE